jgi:hypothetical protein
MYHVLNCPEPVRHRPDFKINLQHFHPVLFTIISSFFISLQHFRRECVLTYKIDVGKYTNNYVDTKCVIIRAVFTYYCDRER